jgi:single-stranded-DNA-specific exonuclease
VDGFPLLEALESCASLFTRFGGHAFAVGFALPAERLADLKRGLIAHAREKLANREPEHLLRIHAELPLERITPVLAGWLRRLEPLGHGNQEPVFVARGVRLLSAPRVMKERHIRLELSSGGQSATGTMRCVGWDWAARCAAHGLKQGSVIDLAYKIRENDHPDYSGIEVEIAGIEIPPA